MRGQKGKWGPIRQACSCCVGPIKMILLYPYYYSSSSSIILYCTYMSVVSKRSERLVVCDVVLLLNGMYKAHRYIQHLAVSQWCSIIYVPHTALG